MSPDCSGEDYRILRDDGELGPDFVQSQFGDVLVVYEYLSRGGLDYSRGER